MSNLDIWEKVRQVPDSAIKPITGGRLRGMSDINPMWRLKTLTEQFGLCGIGWKYEITNKYKDEDNNGQVAVFVDINLYIKVDGEWSAPIPGTGGSMFIANEKNGPYASDECYKMALTDAISVSCKALGIGADVYWQGDRTKYTRPQQEPEPAKTIDGTKAKVVYDLLKKTNSDVNKFLEYYKVENIEDMTAEVWTKAVKALKGKLK